MMLGGTGFGDCSAGRLKYVGRLRLTAMQILSGNLGASSLMASQTTTLDTSNKYLQCRETAESRGGKTGDVYEKFR